MAGYAAGNIVDFVRGFGQRKEAAQIKEAQKNYMADPQAAIAAINDINPETAYQLKQRQAQDAATQQKTALEGQQRYLGAVRNLGAMLGRTARTGGDVGATYDSIVPVLKSGLGFSDADILDWRAKIIANPGLADTLATDADTKLLNLSAGATAFDPVTRQPVYNNPATPKTVQVKRGDGGTDVLIFDPASGNFVTPPTQGQGMQPGTAAPATGGGKLDVATVAPHIVAQESQGDYTARNTETGALGAYQVMPATGAALAQRLGIVWNPGLMTSNTAQGRQYQDQIGAAAVQEAIDNSGGDPRTMAQYYHGGSNRSGWGPKTSQYADEVTARLGGGGVPVNPAPGTRAAYTTPGKPTKENYRIATPEEKAAAGVDAATPYQIGPDGKMEKIGERPMGKGGKGPKAELSQQMLDSLSNQNKIVLDSIDSAIKKANGWTVGSIRASALRQVPGTDAYDLNATLDTIRANIGFDRLQQMREQSPTGGALGQVAVKELEFLQAALGNIDPNQGEAQFVAKLRTIKGHYQALRRALEKDATDIADGTIIKNPKTGARKIMRGGKWEDM